ncbi:STAS domain-containing protein [Kitasatospora indigofera]|uniref:STAS domain-containing protein n=1 Tax=Kitasatospora indigofera TaxID=67307 RepID=UPI003639CE93
MSSITRAPRSCGACCAARWRCGPPRRCLWSTSRVTFCDSAGLNVLLQIRLDAERQGTVVHLARPTHIVTRVLEMTRADLLFPLDPDVPAVRETGGG